MDEVRYWLFRVDLRLQTAVYPHVGFRGWLDSQAQPGVLTVMRGGSQLREPNPNDSDRRQLCGTKRKARNKGSLVGASEVAYRTGFLEFGGP